jgi:predicted RNA binding protein YcfA (HicA-like mRNA interferase family)
LGVPKKIRELIAELEAAGFANRGGKGSHRNYIHAKSNAKVLVSGKPGADAQPYQERKVTDAIRRAGK